MAAKRGFLRIRRALPVTRVAVALIGAAALSGSCSSETPSDPKPTPTETPPAKSPPPPPPEDPVDDGAPLELRGGVGPIHVDALPAAATMVAHVDLAGLADAPLWAENRAIMERDAETKRALTAMRRCELPLEGLRAPDIGVDPRASRLAVIISGAGVGARGKLECLHRELPDQLGAGTWTFDQDEEGRERLLVADARAGDSALVGLLVAEDTLVLASAPWLPAIARGLGGASKPGETASAGPLKPALARVESARHIWFAGTLPADALAALQREGITGVLDVAGALDLSDGLAIALSVRAEDDARAGTMLTRARTQFDNVRPLARLAGVPEGVVDSVSMRQADGGVIELRATLSMEDIRAVRKTLNERAPAGPPPTGAKDP
ncbi:MAG: hypothetical protein KC468_12605 [Myxococcales bacterium]|nr:hypothetical protein [Myxococcales bacterium]